MDDGMPVKIEPCAKRVRVYLGGKIIVDSIRSKLVWEVPHYPAYYFPMAEVSMNSLLESDRTSDRRHEERRVTSMCAAETDSSPTPRGTTRNRLF